jgi:hypothetical protein
MKFYGEKNLVVIDSEKGTKLFQFDGNGEFETDDEKMIKRAVPYFKHEDNIETMKCKKCGAEFTNKGELLAHYRQHKKESD